MILGCFEGYNATILAYGQTSSGKTFTMGTSDLSGLSEEEIGIVPWVIDFIFKEIDKRKAKAEFVVKCSFLEIYNEEIHDLLDPATMLNDNLIKNKKEITIREEKAGQISLYGL